MPFAPLNSSMEKKKKKKRGSSIDESAVAKAAAWAWYQHGSGSEGKPMQEFGITRSRRAPGPSRYKLEAMRIAETATKGTQTPSPVHTGQSLLDTYEVESISKQLDCLIESSRRTNSFRGLLARSLSDGQKQIKLKGDTVAGKKNKSKKFNWFLLRHAAVCGRNGDVDSRAFGVSQRPAKTATTVTTVKCMPWPADALVKN